ncbi:M1 family aminopeptidase [Flavobacterium sp.]|uniref:M1 family aminopeptidase n=1 Tax=Flavobacterium sp. TaxID=239 RepID=UPI003D6AED46
MRKITYLLVLLSIQIGFCQSSDAEHGKMVEAEMKSASKLMDLAVNPNTQNYDVTYSKLEFTVNPASLNMTGKVTTTFKALSNMNTVIFDFYKKATGAFIITSVKKDGANLTFVHNSSHELVITLPAMLTAGNSATVEIIYGGAPSQLEGAFSIATHNGTAVLWTLSEPFGARDWWPCKQDLNDKIDNGVDVYITAPSQYKSVANGIEPEAPVTVGLNKTTHFHHGYPIPAYLVAIAVTNYQVFNQQGGLGTVQSPFFPIINYLYPEEAAATQTSLAVTPDIINFYETKIGPYPYRNEKYGHARANLSGGMEHTTVSFMNSWSRGLIAHEMAHQWFGDKVTCGSWKDIWLNEGITEYMSGLVVEEFDGPTGFVSWKDGKSLNVTSAVDGALYLTDVEAENVGRIFSNRLTYNKGAMVTNMLRFKLGDTNFFQGLRNYLNDSTLAFAYAVTPQFQAHLEAVYGSSLQEFFNDWVYNQGYPTYTVNAHNSAPGQATVQINQTQSDPSVSYFEMPVPVRLTGSSGQQLDVVLNNTSNGQSFVVNVPFTVTGVEFDPNKDIISRNNIATLGTENFDSGAAIQLYPNPVSDILTINLPESITLEKVSLYNTLGQKSLETNQHEINVSQLTSGLYVAVFKTSNGTFHKKIIKK